MAKKRRVWTTAGMDLSGKSIKEQVEICTKKVPAMLEEGAKAEVIVMVADGSPPSSCTEWSILDYKGYGRLCWKYGLKPGMFTGVIDVGDQ